MIPDVPPLFASQQPFSSLETRTVWHPLKVEQSVYKDRPIPGCYMVTVVPADQLKKRNAQKKRIAQAGREWLFTD